MPIIFTAGRYKATDASNAPIPGAFATFYATQTSTLQPIYSDAALQFPLTNPVQADGNGLFPPIYLDDSLPAYKVIFQYPDTANPSIPGALAPDGTIDPINTSFATLLSGIAPFKRTAAEIAAGITPSNYLSLPILVTRYGYVGDGVTDDTTAITKANLAANGRGVVTFPPYLTTARVTSQITIPSGVRWEGAGFSEKLGTGASKRGATCILRDFTGSAATILASGDDVGLNNIDFDNNVQGTGECVQVTGSRFIVAGAISCRNSGGDGFRIGKTDTGASTINANAWRVGTAIVCGNAAAGFRVDDTNTTTSLSYPLGASNANAGYCGLVDARNNGTDGLQIGNANDNVFSMVVSQSNTGCGIRFKTDGTNAGPRCNKILGNDCESNTGNDIQIDAATLPAAAPGLYNLVLGNRSVAVSSKIVDNSSGSLVLQWNSGLGYRGYHFGTDVNSANQTGATGTATFATTVMTVTAATAGTFAVGQNIIAEGVAQGTIISSLGTGTGGTGTYNLSSTPGALGSRGVSAGGQAGVNLHAGPNLALARWYSIPIGAADSALRGQVHKSGGSYTDCLELNENGVFRTWYDLFTLTYSASVTIDTTKGRKFSLSVTDASALTINAPTNVRTGEDFTLIVRNTSGGAMGAITWNAVFKMSAWTNPSNTKSISIRFMYDGTNWVQISGTGVEVPN